jgi:uncharacterized protein YjbJ (UPF0337 family)
VRITTLSPLVSYFSCPIAVAGLFRYSNPSPHLAWSVSGDALIGDKDLESEGKADRRAGEAKEKVGHAKDKVHEVLDKTQDKAEEVIDKTKAALRRK